MMLRGRPVPMDGLVYTSWSCLVCNVWDALDLDTHAWLRYSLSQK
jgi:hypothetical protein